MARATTAVLRRATAPKQHRTIVLCLDAFPPRLLQARANSIYEDRATPDIEIYTEMHFSKIVIAASVAASVQAANNSSSSSDNAGAVAPAHLAAIGAGLALAGAAALLL